MRILMADVEATGVVAVIASSLTVIATVIQGLYANHKGKKRDPQLKKIADCAEHIDQAVALFGERFDRIEARLERVERAQRTRGAPLDDTHSEDKP